MTEIDVGQGAVLGFDWTENAVRWGWNADSRNEVSKQNNSKDEATIILQSVLDKGCESQQLVYVTLLVEPVEPKA